MITISKSSDTHQNLFKIMSVLSAILPTPAKTNGPSGINYIYVDGHENQTRFVVTDGHQLFSVKTDIITHTIKGLYSVSKKGLYSVSKTSEAIILIPGDTILSYPKVDTVLEAMFKNGNYAQYQVTQKASTYDGIYPILMYETTKGHKYTYYPNLDYIKNLTKVLSVLDCSATVFVNKSQGTLQVHGSCHNISVQYLVMPMKAENMFSVVA